MVWILLFVGGWGVNVGVVGSDNAHRNNVVLQGLPKKIMAMLHCVI